MNPKEKIERLVKVAVIAVMILVFLRVLAFRLMREAKLNPAEVLAGPFTVEMLGFFVQGIGFGVLLMAFCVLALGRRL